MITNVKNDEIVTKIKNSLIERLELQDQVSDSELQKMISEEIRVQTVSRHISVKDRIDLGKYIYHSMRKMDVLEELMNDEDITEIMVNGPKDIFFERFGRIERAGVSFASEEALESVIQQIVGKCNRVVNESSPIVDARLLDGSRVNVVLKPIALNGPILTIRRFPDKALLMDDLIKIGSLSQEAAEFLKKLVISGYNLIISGGTGTGKTTFLNALSAYIPRDERVITIEDNAELRIQGVDNLVSMETRNANMEGVKPISIRDLIKSSLRMRPNRIVVGECRGGEAMDMICSAMNCGHDGSMSTIHANSAADSLSRLETMILMAVELPVDAIRRQIAQGVDIIIQLGRMRDKSRKVTEIIEISGFTNGIIKTNPLFRFRECKEEEKSCEKKVKGGLERVGELIDNSKILRAGL